MTIVRANYQIKDSVEKWLENELSKSRRNKLLLGIKISFLLCLFKFQKMNQFMMATQFYFIYLFGFFININLIGKKLLTFRIRGLRIGGQIQRARLFMQVHTAKRNLPTQAI